MPDRIKKRLEVFLAQLPERLRRDQPQTENLLRLVWMSGASHMKELIIGEIAALPDEQAASELKLLEEELNAWAVEEAAKAAIEELEK